MDTKHPLRREAVVKAAEGFLQLIALTDMSVPVHRKAILPLLHFQEVAFHWQASNTVLIIYPDRNGRIRYQIRSAAGEFTSNPIYNGDAWNSWIVTAISILRTIIF